MGLAAFYMVPATVPRQRCQPCSSNTDNLVLDDVVALIAGVESVARVACYCGSLFVAKYL